MILVFPSGPKIYEHIFLERKQVSEHGYHSSHRQGRSKIRFVYLKHALELSLASSNHQPCRNTSPGFRQEVRHCTEHSAQQSMEKCTRMHLRYEMVLAAWAVSTLGEGTTLFNMQDPLLTGCWLTQHSHG